MRPQTQFTRSGDVHIAYKVVGNSPLARVWEDPVWTLRAVRREREA
jgi:hypothetical protein